MSKLKITYNALKGIMIAAIVMGSLFESQATTVYARSNGDWDQTSKWSTSGVGGSSCSCVPGATDDVVIDGYEIDIDGNTGNVTIASLTMTNDRGDKMHFDIEDGMKLTITGDLTVTSEDEEEDVVRCILKMITLKWKSREMFCLLEHQIMMKTRKLS